MKLHLNARVHVHFNQLEDVWRNRPNLICVRNVPAEIERSIRNLPAGMLNTEDITNRRVVSNRRKVKGHSVKEVL